MSPAAYTLASVEDLVGVAEGDQERQMNLIETPQIHKSMAGKGSDKGKKPMASAAVEKAPPAKKPVFGEGEDEDRIKLLIWLVLSLSRDCFKNEKKKSMLRGFHNDILNSPQARENLWPTTPARPLGAKY
ncbi:hypothetical protein M9H77_27049 [Catharanthus roseus]|uniref:Uncharacterized protein n=1 Tax=Catharanthus roseus TaxID=4058 RepID=A0ACC0ABX4_CATRO|nr:hypothetical protein M9H77_27049 [Catharanthus roseus]